MNIKNRNIVTSVILSLVTCGIYQIYWAICLARDAVSVNSNTDDGVLEILLMIFLPFVEFYLCERKLASGCNAKNIPHTDNSIVYLVLGLIGLSIVDYCMMQNDLNKMADDNIQ